MLFVGAATITASILKFHTALTLFQSGHSGMAYNSATMSRNREEDSAICADLHGASGDRHMDFGAVANLPETAKGDVGW